MGHSRLFHRSKSSLQLTKVQISLAGLKSFKTWPKDLSNGSTLTKVLSPKDGENFSRVTAKREFDEIPRAVPRSSRANVFITGPVFM